MATSLSTKAHSGYSLFPSFSIKADLQLVLVVRLRANKLNQRRSLINSSETTFWCATRGIDSWLWIFKVTRWCNITEFFLYELFMLLIKKKIKNGGKDGATHSPSSASQQKAIHFLNMSFQAFLWNQMGKPISAWKVDEKLPTYNSCSQWEPKLPCFLKGCLNKLAATFLS